MLPASSRIPGESSGASVLSRELPSRDRLRPSDPVTSRAQGTTGNSPQETSWTKDRLTPAEDKVAAVCAQGHRQQAGPPETPHPHQETMLWEQESGLQRRDPQSPNGLSPVKLRLLTPTHPEQPSREPTLLCPL